MFQSMARQSSPKANTSPEISLADSKCRPAAGRLIFANDDRAGAVPVAVLSLGYCERRFGDVASATGQQILINSVPFTVVGVTPSEFFGVDPAAAPQVYLPMHASLLFDPGGGLAYLDQNYYWVEMMGRLRPGVGLAQAQASLAGAFAQWVATTATKRSRACQSSRAAPGGRGRWPRQPEAPVLEAALRVADDGRPDPGDRVREHGESAARAGRRPQARDGSAAQPGRRTLACRPSTPDGERSPGVRQRRSRHPHRHRRHPRADAAAGQWRGRIHAARRPELACPRRDAVAVAAVRPAVWPGAGDAVDTADVDADAQRPVRDARCGGACARGSL